MVHDPGRNQHANGNEQFSDDVHFVTPNFYVKARGSNGSREEWHPVDSFSTKEEALKFLHENFGPNENDFKITKL